MRMVSSKKGSSIAEEKLRKPVDHIRKDGKSDGPSLHKLHG